MMTGSLRSGTMFHGNSCTEKIFRHGHRYNRAGLGNFCDIGAWRARASRCRSGTCRKQTHPCACYPGEASCWGFRRGWLPGRGRGSHDSRPLGFGNPGSIWPPFPSSGDRSTDLNRGVFRVFFWKITFSTLKPEPVRFWVI